MPEPIPEGTPLACPKCGSQAAAVEKVLGSLDWGLVVVGRDGVVHPAEHRDPPVVTADNSSTVGVWAVCDARSCGHQWKLRRRFDAHPIEENADA
jgi:hypothetical protein